MRRVTSAMDFWTDPDHIQVINPKTVEFLNGPKDGSNEDCAMASGGTLSGERRECSVDITEGRVGAGILDWSASDSVWSGSWVGRQG
jgi:hypothetical protein